jgi:hypothetical protein
MAGDRLINRLPDTRALYFLGIATDKYYPNLRSFKQALNRLDKEFCEDPSGRSHTPFWQFLSGITLDMSGKRHYDCIELWGWSNLFKIAYNSGRPSEWDPAFYEDQRQVGAMALAHEFAQLSNAVIFIGTNDDHQMIRSVLPDVEWDMSYNVDGISFWQDDRAHNLYIWGYHPLPARLNRFFDRMLARTKSHIAPSVVRR